MRISKDWHQKMRGGRGAPPLHRARAAAHRFNVVLVLPMAGFADDSAERISRAG
jgi:hypothetical protein